MLSELVCFYACLLWYAKCHSVQQSCTGNCSSTSFSNKKEMSTGNLISCSIQDKQCSTRAINGPQNKPYQVSEVLPAYYLTRDMWYLHRDGLETKVALNFSWTPAADDTIGNLQGYRILISKLLPNREILWKKEIFYCFNIQLSFEKHLPVIFHFDCSQLLSQFPAVIPGDKFSVSISSLPTDAYNDHLSIDISIPPCTDSHMVDVQACIIRKHLWIKVHEINCAERAVNYSFNIPNMFGNTAIFEFCAVAEDQKKLCKTWKSALFDSVIPLQVPKSFRKLNNFTLAAWGSALKDKKAFTVISFEQCEKTATVRQLILTVTPGISAILFLILAGKFLHFALKKPPLVSNKPHKPNLYAGPLQQGQNKTKKTRILLVFNPDHPKHEEVVVTFAQYLQGDLGFDVVFMPWESTIAIEKLSDWISNSIKCDKVIAVWSPAAKIAWYQHNTSMDETPSVFTTIIRHIQEDVVYKKHHGKYFFAYFDYCTDEVLPTDISITRFNLMKDFKELYFRLVDEEQYIPGKRCNYENVSFDAYANQKFGSALNATIAAMHSIAKIDSNWYKNNESKKHYKNCIFTTPQSLHTHSRIPQGPWKNIIPIVHPGNVPINADNKEHRNGSDHEAHCNYGNTQSVTTYNSAKSSFYLSMSTIGEETPSDTTPLHHRNDTESTMPYEENIISAFRQNLVPCSPIKLAPVSNEGNPVKKLKEINMGNSC
ncbi:interleukin-17 receptor A-like [Clavelina lepadiformis]|uniref:interleukin-17 receptor A-like n=1 Tax=Clavelina lepadiformis TaxID=159417 RepID=UPI0040422E6F